MIAPLHTLWGTDAAAITKYIHENTVYPVYAKDKAITGNVIIRFTLSGEGNISTARILSGNSPDLNMEAMRVLLESKDWKPATSSEGNPVDSFFTIKVNFSPDK